MPQLRFLRKDPWTPVAQGQHARRSFRPPLYSFIVHRLSFIVLFRLSLYLHLSSGPSREKEESESERGTANEKRETISEERKRERIKMKDSGGRGCHRFESHPFQHPHFFLLGTR
jgi:hypothetical protein